MEVRHTAEVLLVDDNAADLDLTKDVLGRGTPGCRILTVQDGEQALDLLRKEKARQRVPIVVLLDLNLPRKDGRAVLAELKRDPELKTTPVLVFTTSNAPGDIDRAYELGANCYVRKPGNLRDFVEVLTAVKEFWLNAVQLPGR